MLGVEYFKRHGPRLEAGVMKDADLVVANSAYLANYARKFNVNSFDIGQGCDLEKYLADQPPVPEDMKFISKPVIGYMGYISAWRINAEIIIYLAEKLPHCNIVLVGPADELFKQVNISHLPNLHLLGARPSHILAHYISYFDICINPQLLNKITIGNYPRKVDEYLAMGKAVVATETEAMLPFKPYTYLCKTKEEWVDVIKMILDNPDKTMSPDQAELRRSFAMSHTWTNSIGRLGDAYYKTIKPVY
jgi:glycosyltransferase involved in cell wall biosynthesis